MGTQSIVYGRILLETDKVNSTKNIDKAIEYINTLKNDNSYPFIRTEMFSVGSKERPYYYDQQIITFGATYKAVEYDWKAFILKFEMLLKNIEFDTAKIKLETEFLGTYDFFWKKKTKNNEFDKKEKLIETDLWYFGYACRDAWGFLEHETDEPVFEFNNFKYPVTIDEDELHAYNQLMKNIDKNKKGIKQYPHKKGMDTLHLYQKAYNKLLVENFCNKIDFGFDKHISFDADIMKNEKFYIIIKD